MIWVGIDPGRSGAMALVREDGTAEAWPTPMLDSKTYDIDRIADWFRSWRPHIALVTVERLTGMPMPGTLANFSRGESRGWMWMLAGLRIPHHPVAPQTWQKAMMPGKGDTKARSVRTALELYPGVSLLESERARVHHDGMADALLLATYGRQLWEAKGK